jgi:hypothetical protein
MVGGSLTLLGASPAQAAQREFRYSGDDATPGVSTRSSCGSRRSDAATAGGAGVAWIMESRWLRGWVIQSAGAGRRTAGHLSTFVGGQAYGRWHSSRGKWSHMRGLLSRFSDWVVAHPVLWGVGAGAVLVLLGFALNLSPIVVVAAGAVVGALNILHARRRGYCPVPTEPASQSDP